MLCAVYKSPIKDETYLYLPRRDDFSQVPDALMETFGKPVYVMTFNMDKREKLALAEKDKVQAMLEQQGYYLQLPPPKENLLKTFRKANGLGENH